MEVVPQAAVCFFSCSFTTLSFKCCSIRIWDAMCGKCGGLASVYWSRSLSRKFCRRCSSKDRNPGYERSSTLSGSTRRAVCISDLQHTSNFHLGPVEPAFTFTFDIWEFLTFRRAFPGLCSAPGSLKCLYRWCDISRLQQDDLLKRHPPLNNYSDVRHQGPQHQTFCCGPFF